MVSSMNSDYISSQQRQKVLQIATVKLIVRWKSEYLQTSTNDSASIMLIQVILVPYLNKYSTTIYNHCTCSPNPCHLVSVTVENHFTILHVCNIFQVRRGFMTIIYK